VSGSRYGAKTFRILNRQSSIRNRQSLAPTPWSLPLRPRPALLVTGHSSLITVFKIPVTCSLSFHSPLLTCHSSLFSRPPFELPRTFSPGPCHAAMDSFLRSPALGALSHETVRCMLQWSREPKQDACGEEMTVHG